MTHLTITRRAEGPSTSSLSATLFQEMFSSAHAPLGKLLVRTFIT